MALAIVCNLSPEPRLGASDKQFLLNLRQNLSNMYKGIAIGGGEQGWAYFRFCRLVWIRKEVLLADPV